MRRLLKWLGITMLVVLGVAGLAVAVLWVLSGRRINEAHDVPEEAAVPIRASSAAVARGRYLATSVTSCVLCHGPDFGGIVYADAGPMGMIIGSNLTRGRGGSGATSTDRDWERAIRHGVRPDGSSLVIMPSEVFVHLSDEDFAAIVAFMRQLAPVDRDMPRSYFRFLGRMLIGAGQLPVLVAEKTPEVRHVSAVPHAVTADYGRYLADIGGCHGCHGEGLSGRVVPGPPGAPPPSNITPTGIGQWTAEDFFRAMRDGRRPNGTAIDEFMPWQVMGNMTDSDLHALWLYLKTVPPRPSGTS